MMDENNAHHQQLQSHSIDSNRSIISNDSSKAGDSENFRATGTSTTIGPSVQFNRKIMLGSGLSSSFDVTCGQQDKSF